MKISIDIDDRHEETGITIQTKEWTEELGEILNIAYKTKQQHQLEIGNDQESM